MTRERKDILVYDVPDEIREALIQEARAADMSINDMAVGILCKRFRVRHNSTGAPFAEGDVVNLAIRGGARLHQKIDIERARRGGGTLRGVVLETLALHYDLEPPPIGRRPRTKGGA